MRPAAAWAALLILAAPHLASAAVVSTISAEQFEGRLSAITADGRLVLLDAAGKESSVPLDQVFRVVVLDRAPALDPGVVADVRTVGGTRLVGALAEPTQSIAVTSRALGKPLHFDVARILGVRFFRNKDEQVPLDRFEAELRQGDRQRDVLYIASPKGVIPIKVAVEKITPSKTHFNWDGQNRTVDTGRVAAILFANPPAAEPARAAVRLNETSILRGTIISLEKGAIDIDIAGAKVSVPLDRVLSIDLANPNLVFLSDLQPVEVKEIPFFNHIWPHQVDRSVAGNPLMLDGREYARGIGCHTKTILAYDLGGQYRKFSAVIGIDDEARPHGSVQFVVKIVTKQDDKVAEKEVYSVRLTGRDKAVPIVLDISGAQRIILITDFAEDASVGDHADWADARVTK